jgi:microcystin-dependent protein
MSSPFIGEIRLFAGTFAPQGWSFCNGALLPISSNEVLFNLLGTTYGGDGQNTFALPDLRGRVPIHMGVGPQGDSFVQGQSAGTESVTVTVNQIPSHHHSLQASRNAANAASPGNNVFAQGPPGGIQVYTDDNTVAPAAIPVSLAGGGLSHENRQPLLAVSFIISQFGIFPSQS